MTEVLLWVLASVGALYAVGRVVRRAQRNLATIWEIEAMERVCGIAPTSGYPYERFRRATLAFLRKAAEEGWDAEKRREVLREAGARKP